jgi:pimeloyl-ACP methyl ester carboxylesterase
LGVVVLVVAAPVMGWIYQLAMEARDDARFPPPGRIVDVDAHRMHIFCQGSGSPTVIVEQGIGAQSLGWAPINERMSAITTVCAYDRAGMGYSDALDHATPATEVARRLHTLLGKVGIEDIGCRSSCCPRANQTTRSCRKHIHTWSELQDELAQLSSNGRHIVATGSAHAIHRTEPQLIVNALREVVAAARGGGGVQ